MWTIEYRPGFFIHGYFDHPTCRIVTPDGEQFSVPSLHSAKCRVTRAYKVWRRMNGDK